MTYKDKIEFKMIITNNENKKFMYLFLLLVLLSKLIKSLFNIQ